MKQLFVGLGYDPVDVVIDETKTVRDAFRKAGKENLLAAKYTVNFAKNGGAGAVIRDFDVTLASLGVEDGDGFLASENLKSA